MAFTKNTDDLNVIQKLPDEPNDVGGLTAAQLKAKFDEAGGKLKTSLNGLIDELGATTAAANIGFASTTGVQEDNVQDAIENVQGQLAEISQGSVADGTITSAKLADSAVTTGKIADGSVTLGKLASDVVSSLAATWEDISDDVTIDSSGVRSFSKIFRYSSILKLVFFQLTFYASGSTSVDQYGKYLGAFQYFSAVSCSNASAAAGINCKLSNADYGTVNHYSVSVSSEFSGGYVTLSGFYFCNGEGS